MYFCFYLQQFQQNHKVVNFFHTNVCIFSVCPWPVSMILSLVHRLFFLEALLVGCNHCILWTPHKTFCFEETLIISWSSRHHNLSFVKVENCFFSGFNVMADHQCPLYLKISAFLFVTMSVAKTDSIQVVFMTRYITNTKHVRCSL